MMRSFLRKNLCLRRNYSNFQNLSKKKYDPCEPSVSIQLTDAYQLYNLDESPKSTVSLKRSEGREYYTTMQTIRRMENAIANLYRTKEVRGFCHLYIGQEACCVGMKAAMRPMDTIITSYRSHGWTYMMGVMPRSIIAELSQKQIGCTRGKGGSMHTYGKNFYGGNGIVGGQVPLGVGAALAHAYRADGGVNFAIYGDGAANQGQIYEAYNMACLWKLPVVFVCENNKYGMGTSVERSSCSTTYFTRGDYIPGIWVNAMDVLAVRSATEFVIEHALNVGPIVMELETYRYLGHSMSDPGISYRNRDEIENVRKSRDTIENLRNICLKHNLLTEEEIKEIDDYIKNEIAADTEESRSAKFPDLEELWCDVYLNNLEESIRGTVFRNLKHKNVGHLLSVVGAPRPTPRSEIQMPPPPEPKPKKEGDPKTEKETKGDGKPKAEGEPKTEAKPKAEEEPKAKGQVKAEGEPTETKSEDPSATPNTKTDATSDGDLAKTKNAPVAAKEKDEVKPEAASTCPKNKDKPANESASELPKQDLPSSSTNNSNNQPKDPSSTKPST